MMQHSIVLLVLMALSGMKMEVVANDAITMETVVDEVDEVDGDRELANQNKRKKNKKVKNKNKKNRNKKNKKVYWPYTPKPTPKPTAKPTSKPTPKPTYPILVCKKNYTFEFYGTPTNIDVNANGAQDFGDYSIFSGDLWTKDEEYRVGFFEAIKYFMNPINPASDPTMTAFAKDIDLVIGSFQIKHFGEIAFSAYEMDKRDPIFDPAVTQGPESVLAITGGTGHFEGASGKILCRKKRQATGANFLEMRVFPYCPVYPAKKVYADPPAPEWPAPEWPAPVTWP